MTQKPMQQFVKCANMYEHMLSFQFHTILVSKIDGKKCMLRIAKKNLACEIANLKTRDKKFDLKSKARRSRKAGTRDANEFITLFGDFLQLHNLPNSVVDFFLLTLT